MNISAILANTFKIVLSLVSFLTGILIMVLGIEAPAVSIPIASVFLAGALGIEGSVLNAIEVFREK